LSMFRRLAAGASEWLAPDAHLFSEMSTRQAPLAATILAEHGLATRIAVDDDLGATLVIGTN
jgi:release factor glutamine methyltransferase